MEKKTERVQLLVSKEELADIKEKAKQLGVTVSAYFRLKALGRI